MSDSLSMSGEILKQNKPITQFKERNNSRISLLDESQDQQQNMILQNGSKEAGEVQKHVEQELIIPVKLSEKERKRAEKNRILAEESRRRGANKYKKYGVGFDLNSVKINDADSGDMVELKKALKEYLQLRESIIAQNKLSNKELGEAAGEEAQQEADQIKYIYRGNLQENDEVRAEDEYKRMAYTGAEGLTENQYDKMRAAYAELHYRIQQYTAGKKLLFRFGLKFGRGKARLKQVIKIADMLRADNRRFNLSELRHDLVTSHDKTMEDMTAGVFPTYLGMVRQQDRIHRRDEDLNKRGANHFYHWRYWATAIKNIPNRVAQLYHFAGGTAFRLAAIPTMIAANALEFVGKTAKLGMKGLAEAVNLGPKLFGKKWRWNIKFNRQTLSGGWTSLSRARKMHLMAFKYIGMAPLVYTADLLKEAVQVPAEHIAAAIRGEDVAPRKHFVISRGHRSTVKKFFSRQWNNIKNFFGTTKDYATYSQEDTQMTMADAEENEVTKFRGKNVTMGADDNFDNSNDDSVDDD